MALQLSGSNIGLTGSFNTTTEGIYSGSFSGSFVGDGSGLTGIAGGSGGGDYSPYITGSVSTGILPTEGSNCTTIGNNSTIAGGTLNTASVACGFIGGGSNNKLVAGNRSAIVVGSNNCIDDNGGCDNFIGGGSNNDINPSSIQGQNFIGAGHINCITGNYSSIIAGQLNTVSHGNSHIIGSNLTSNKDNYTFMNNLDVEGTVSGSIFSGSFVGDGSGLTGIAGGGGTVDTSGNPSAGRLAVFTDSDTITGYSDLTWDNSFDDSKLTISGYIVPDIIIGEGVISASIFSGSFVGDGSGLTGIPGGGNGEYVPFITGSVSSGILPREGENFTTLGANATIAGGRLNTGSAPCSFIGGGRSNKVCTNGQYGSVLGGQNNQVHFCHGVVAGGLNNTANSCASSILGGADNCVQSSYSTVVSGRCNEIKQSSEHSFIGAGLNNTGSARCGFIGGGENNSMTHGGNNAIVGGCNNCVSGSTNSSILAGFNNCIGLSETFTLPCVTDPQPAAYSAIGAGKDNCMLHYYSFIGAGSDNVIDNIYGFIGAGRNNCIKFDTQGFANPSDSFIGSGRNNCVFGDKSVIVGGEQNRAYGADNGIVGGLCNTTFGLYSFIGAGNNNCISGSIVGHSGIVGGCANHVCHNETFIVGSNITSSAHCTTFVNNLTISGSQSDNGIMTLKRFETTPTNLGAGSIFHSGSAGAGCLYFSPNGSSICRIAFV